MRGQIDAADVRKTEFDAQPYQTVENADFVSLGIKCVRHAVPYGFCQCNPYNQAKFRSR